MRKEKDMRPDAKVPFIEKMGFSLGGQGYNIFLMIISSFLLVYYTNVVGISAGLVATIMGISKLLDGLSDLTAGWILDRTHTKYGKCRPWLLRMIIPTAVCMVLMMSVPAGISTTAKAVYIFVTYNLVNTVCLTMMSVAHTALNGSMSMNQKDRGINGGFQMLFGIVGGLVLNSTVIQITSAVGNGDPYTQSGWTAMIIVYAVVFLVLSIFGFFFTTERVTLAQWENDETSGGEKNKEKDNENDNENDNNKKNGIGVLAALKILIKDKYWVIFVITMICVVFMQTSLGMSNVYYAQYILDDVMLYTPLGNFQSIGAMIGAIVTLPLMAKLKKRNICMTGLLSVAFGSFIPAITSSLSALYLAAALKGVGVGIAACVLPGMLQDSITYAQWQSGKDVLGMGNAAYSFSNKIGSSIGTIILGWLLEAGGFDGALAVQPSGALVAINSLYIWIPGIMMVLAAICMAFYDLDSKYDKISADLKQRMGLADENN